MNEKQKKHFNELIAEIRENLLSANNVFKDLLDLYQQIGITTNIEMANVPPIFGKWMPIDTVPKDGTAVLLCWSFNKDGSYINWASDPKTAGVFVQVAAWWEEEGVFPGDWIVYCSLPEEPRLHFAPTHWMPLPEPPPSRG